MFRFERWIPAKWRELHEVFSRAAEAGAERVPCVLSGAGPNATQWTSEQEYLIVLLIHQLNTGNMSPPQLDWAMSQLRAWSRRLQLDAVPRSAEGFFVDIAGKTASAVAPATTPARCCATSTPARSPSSWTGR